MNAFNFKLKFAYAILIFSLFSSLGNSQTITIQLTPSNYNGYNISCLGGRDGSITANVTGGFPPYHYLWSINDTNATISGLSADYYHLVVTDSHSNTKEAEINLHEPEILKVNPTLYVYPNGFNVSQFGACNGSATLTITGGVAPFTYGWTPGQQAISNPSNLCGRFNSVTVIDANGCRATATMSLSEPDRDDWTVGGNAGVDPATQYMGTNDNNDLVIKTNSIERARIKANGDFNINRVITNRIVSPDSIISFGDSTIQFATGYNRLYGDPLGANNKGTAIGLRAFCPGLYSSSMGYNTSSGGQYSTAIGYRVQAQQAYSFVIGSGTSLSNMSNTISNTIMLGCNSTVPTVFISAANGGTTTGSVGIGTTDIPSGYKLAVDGKIIATELKIQLKNLWPPDYVFENDYKLMSIGALKEFIENNHHLPEIPTAKNMLDNGVDTSEMLILLLKKVEELTLYVIQQQSEIDNLKQNRKN